MTGDIVKGALLGMLVLAGVLALLPPPFEDHSEQLAACEAALERLSADNKAHAERVLRELMGDVR